MTKQIETEESGSFRVAPLEWVDMGEGPRCITVCGMYAIHPSSGPYGTPTVTLTGMPGNLFGKFATVDEAKVSAQSDYERRINSALVPLPTSPNVTDVPNAKDVQAAALRSEIETLLGECTEAQTKFFHRIHDSAPWKGFTNCPSEKLSESYELVRRTVMHNQPAKATT